MLHKVPPQNWQLVTSSCSDDANMRRDVTRNRMGASKWEQQALTSLMFRDYGISI